MSAAGLPLAAAPRSRAGNTVGTRSLVRLALRRDRIILPVWVVVLAGLGLSTYRSYETLFPTVASRTELAASLGTSPALKVLYGPAFDLSTAGGFVAWRLGGFLALFTAIMAMMTVVRHTRAEEDTGRAELVGSGVVGRLGMLTSAVAVALGASAAVGAVLALALAASGAPASGALALGAACAACGAVFTGVAAVTAQVGSFSRTANGLSFIVLGVAFLLRAVGDTTTTSATWLSWLSPLSWAMQVQSFVGNRWWVLLLSVVVSVVLLGLAVRLSGRRDVGRGLMAPRGGRPVALPSLRSSLALTWRLSRPALLGWAVALAVIGLVLGSLTGSIKSLLSGNQAIEQAVQRLGGSAALEQTFVSAMLGMLALVAAVYGVQAVLRARSEESDGRAEALLAAGVSRRHWLGGHLLGATAGATLLMLVGASAVGITAAATSSVTIGQTVGGSLVQLPAIWVVVGVAALLVGVLPRLSVLGWAVAGLVVLVSLWGEVLNLPDAVLDVSPFQHVPHLPGGELVVLPLVVLLVLAAALFAGALAGIHRRDVG